MNQWLIRGAFFMSGALCLKLAQTLVRPVRAALADAPADAPAAAPAAAPTAAPAAAPAPVVKL